jgi:hypothetical protein
VPGQAIVAGDVIAGHVAASTTSRESWGLMVGPYRGAASAGTDPLPTIRAWDLGKAGECGDTQQDCATQRWSYI